MTSTLITGIGELTTMDPNQGKGSTGIITNAAVVSENGRIRWVGPHTQAPASDEKIDLDGRALMPGMIDTHTHLAFAGNRLDECLARLSGTPYDASGIASTLAATREASDDELRRSLETRITEAHRHGTAIMEIKSGYSLDVNGERRLLQLMSEYTSETTFLGAHVVPPEYARRRSDYIDLVAGPMLDSCKGLARWADVFCEPHSVQAFSGEESETLIEAFTQAGLGLRIHAGQLGIGPGVELAVTHGAASLDHLNYLSRHDIDLLAAASPHQGPVATVLPLVDVQSGGPLAPARTLIDAGVTLAIATDANPGTNASTSLPAALVIAVNLMALTPTEAIRAVTTNAAAALRRDDIGIIAPGAHASFTVVDAESINHLFYRPGVNLAHALILEDTPIMQQRSDYRW